MPGPDGGATSASGRGGLPGGAPAADLIRNMDDTNQLQTRLAAAIVAEDYSLASLLRDRLEEVNR